MSYPPPPPAGPPPGGYGGPPPGGYPPPGGAGYGGPSAYRGSPPSNNMGMSIAALVVSLLCGGCFPLGIVAIVMSAQVQGKWSSGDVAGATKSATTARTVSIVSFVISALVFIGLVVYFATADTSTAWAQRG